MDQTLTPDDRQVIIEALKYYRTNIENYDGYPSYQFKQTQLARLDSALSKFKLPE